MATLCMKEEIPPVLNSTSESPSLFDETTRCMKEEIPPILNSTSESPSLFDGTTRLYISLICPYAQHTWVARNYKGLQDKIKLVAIDLQDKPAWYKEKVYSPNKVPCLEHNNEVKGESLDLLKYINTSFEGPALLPDDQIKREFAEELLAYTPTFNKVVMCVLMNRQNPEAEMDATLDYLEKALSKFEDGPFFLGEFSMVDIAYAPFFERYHPLLLDVKNYDLTIGRPNLVSSIAAMEKIEAFTQTKYDTEALLVINKALYLNEL